MSATNSHHQKRAAKSDKAAADDVPQKKLKVKKKEEEDEQPDDIDKGRNDEAKVALEDETLEAKRLQYEEQVEAGEMCYSYPNSLWYSDRKGLFCDPPKSLAGVYDIIYLATVRVDTDYTKIVKEATLIISQDGKKIHGRVEGDLSYAGNFKFEGSVSNFSILEFDEDAWGGEPFEQTPTGTLDVLAERVDCRWIPEYDKEDDTVPECETIEEANEFLAKQANANAWTPPCPFFFFENGDLRIKVVWEKDVDVNDCISQYIARKRPTTKTDAV